MPIGYNPTTTGDVQLTFPSIADEHRTLGHAYGPRRYVIPDDIDMGPDRYGWGADARRMANAKVQSTISAYPVYDRTARHRIQPTQLRGSSPFFSSIDQSDEAMRRWISSGVHGGGSIGALTTPEGQKYRKVILNRRGQELTALRNQQDTAALPPTEMNELTEKEAQKDELLDELDAIVGEVSSGIFERNTAKELVEWLGKFLKLMPYFSNVEHKELTQVYRTLGDIVGADIRIIGNRTNLAEIVRRRNMGVEGLSDVRAEQDQENLAAYISDRIKLTRRIIAEYEGLLNYSLKERIMGYKAILRKYRLGQLASGVKAPTEQETIDDEDDNDYEPPPFVQAQADDAEAPALNEEEAAAEPDLFAGLNVVQPPQLPDNVPPYRSQAQITTEVARRRTLGVERDVAIRQIAQEWAPFTRYMPRPNTNFTAVRRTLVGNINRFLDGFGARGRGRGVRNRLHPHQQMVAMRRQMEQLRR